MGSTLGDITLGDVFYLKGTNKCHFWTVPQVLWHLTSHKMCPQKKRKKRTHPPNPTSDYIKKCQFLMKTDLHWLCQESLSSSIFAKETPLPGHGKKWVPYFILFFSWTSFFAHRKPFKARFKRKCGMLLYQHKKPHGFVSDGRWLLRCKEIVRHLRSPNL